MSEYIDNAHIKVEFDTSELKRSVIEGKVRKSLDGVKDTVVRTMRAAAIAASAAFGASLTLGTKVAAELETTAVSFEKLLGTKSAALEYMSVLEKFASTTPTSFAQVTGAAKTLLVAGVELERIVPILTRLGDGAAMMGTIHTGGLEQLTRALAQVQAKGKITAEEMIQLAEGGLDAWDALASQLGVTKAEAMDLVSTSTIDPSVLFTAIEQGAGESLQRVSGSMEAISQTMTGKWSTFVDTIKFASGRAFAPLMPAANAALTAMTVAVEKSGPKMINAISGAVGMFTRNFTTQVEHEWIPTLHNGFVKVEKVAKPPPFAVQEWRKFQSGVSEVFDGLKSAGSEVFKWVERTSDTWLPKLQTGFETLRDDYVVPFKDSVVDALKFVEDLFAGADNTPRMPDFLDPNYALNQFDIPSETLEERWLTAIKNIDWVSIGTEMGLMLASTLEKIFAVGGVFLEKMREIEWAKIGWEAGKLAAPLVISFMAALWSQTDITVLAPLVKDHWQELLIAALGLVVVGKFLKPLAKLLQRIPFVGPIMAWLSRGLGTLFTPASNLFWRSIQLFLMRAFPRTERLLSRLFPKLFENAGTKMPGWMKKMTDPISRHIENAALKLGGGVAKMIEAIIKLVGGLAKRLKGVFKKGGEDVGKSTAGMVTGVGVSLGGLGAVVSGATGGVRQGFSTLSNGITGAVGGIGDKITGLWGNRMDELAPRTESSMETTGASLRRGTDDAVAGMNLEFDSSWADFMADMDASMSEFSDPFDTAWLDANNSFDSGVKGMSHSAELLRPMMRDTGVGVMHEVDIFSDAMAREHDLMGDDLVSSWGTMSADAESGAGAMSTGVTRELASLVSAVIVEMQRMNRESLLLAREYGHQMPPAMTSGYPKIQHSTRNMFSVLRDTVWNRLTGIRGDATNRSLLIGSSLLDGLGSGLTTFGGKVYSWAKKVQNAVVSAIKKVFQIKSPSRIMMSMGKHLLDGLLLPMISAPNHMHRLVKNSIGDVSAYLRRYFGMGGYGGSVRGGFGPARPGRFDGVPFGGGTIVDLGRWLQRFGIRVAEHPAFGGVAPVHKGRGHYEGRALDINYGPGGKSAKETNYFNRLAPVLKAMGYKVLWRVRGHYGHIHVESPSRGWRVPSYRAQRAIAGGGGSGNKAFDRGGLLGPKPGWFFKDHTHGPERVLSAKQNDLFERHIRALERGAAAGGGVSVDTITIHEATDGEKLARDTMREFERIRRRQLAGAQ